MRQVTEAEFFAALKADPRDIMPTFVNDQYDPVTGYTLEWRSNNYAHILFGKSDGTGETARYWLVES